MKQGSMAARSTAVLISLFASAAWTSGVDQPPRTVGELATWCRDGLQPWMPRHEPSAVEAARGAYCFAYVQAVIDNRFIAPGDPHCLPAGASQREIVEGFVLYVATARNDVRDAEVGQGVDMALQAAYRCTAS